MIDEYGLEEPSNNTEAEQGLLAILLMDATSRDDLLPSINIDYFFTYQHQLIFKAIELQHATGQELYPKDIAAKLKDEACLNEDNKPYVMLLAENYMGAFNGKNYVAEIEKHYQLRTVKEIYLSAAAELDDPTKKVDDIVSNAEQDVFKTCYEEQRQDYSNTASAMTAAITHIEAIRKGEIPPAIATGLTEIDSIIKGLNNTDLNILAGRPGMGKTGLALSVALNAALDGKHVLFHSLEMSSEQLIKRLMAMQTGISLEQIMSGELSDEEMQILVSAQATIASLPIIFNDNPSVTAANMLMGARRLKRKGMLDLVIIDYLQLMRASRDVQGKGRYEEVSEISRDIKAMAKRLDVPLLALAQLSRSVESREDKRPMLSDLRDSGQIEQDADRILFAYREEYYLEKSQPKQGMKTSDEHHQKNLLAWGDRMEQVKNKCDVIVAKNRHGKAGTATTAFISHLTKFEDLKHD